MLLLPGEGWLHQEGELVMPKYQGKELQSTLQAPTESSLQEMVESARGFAEENKLEEFKILEFGKDPDGGYRAIVTAHNWNPISWIKGKLTRKKEPEGEEVPGEVPELEGATAEGAWEETERLRKETEDVKAGEERRKQEERLGKEQRKQQEEFAREERERLGSEEEEKRKKEEEEFLKRFPPKYRKEAKKRFEEAEREKTSAAFEVWSQSVPEAITQYHKTLQKEYWTDKDTGQPVPEPRTAEERARSDYHPSQWAFQPVERKLSSPERLAVARTLELEGMELEMARDKYKQFKRERHPAYRAVKAAGGFGQFMAGAVTLGVAGVARGAQPGRGGPARAARMHAPGVPMELYAVRPVLGVGMPTAKDLTGSGLGHLRSLTLPGIRRTRKQVGQVRRSIEE